MKQETNNDRKLNILFISSNYSYFINSNAQFRIMYKNLKLFYDHKDFNIIVLQPKNKKYKEDLTLKKKILCYYYRMIRIFNNEFFIFNDFNPFFIVKVIKILKTYKINLIHFEFPLGISIVNILTKVPISYSTHNVEYIFANRIGKYSRKMPKFIKIFYLFYIYYLEKNSVKKSKNINALSSNDKEYFIKLYNISPNKIIINSQGYIDEIYHNQLDQKEARDLLNIDKNKFIIIYHGDYSSYADKEALDLIKNQIAPLITNKNILFLIAGKNMPYFKNSRNIKFLGFVKDLKSFLFSADIAIIPILRGSGIRTKILDYLSAKIPIISTKKGIEGHYLKNGKHGFIVDYSKETIKSKIIYLMDNPDIISKIKKNIEILLKEKYDWEKNSRVLTKRYKKIIKSSSLRI